MTLMIFNQLLDVTVEMFDSAKLICLFHKSFSVFFLCRIVDCVESCNNRFTPAGNNRFQIVNFPDVIVKMDLTGSVLGITIQNLTF